MKGIPRPTNFSQRNVAVASIADVMTKISLSKASILFHFKIALLWQSNPKQDDFVC